MIGLLTVPDEPLHRLPSLGSVVPRDPRPHLIGPPEAAAPLFQMSDRAHRAAQEALDVLRSHPARPVAVDVAGDDAGLPLDDLLDTEQALFPYGCWEFRRVLEGGRIPLDPEIAIHSPGP